MTFLAWWLLWAILTFGAVHLVSKLKRHEVFAASVVCLVIWPLIAVSICFWLANEVGDRLTGSGRWAKK